MIKLRYINKSLWLALAGLNALMIIVASVMSILLSLATALIIHAVNGRTNGLIGEISFTYRFIGWLALIFLTLIIDKLIINRGRSKI